MKTKLFFAAVVLVVSGFAALAQETRSKTDPVKVGEIAPDFALRDESGKTIKLSDLKQPTVIVFYRAYWCPFCVRQLAELRSLKQDGDRFQLLAVSRDPTNRAIETKTKIAKDGKGDLGFPLLSDPGGKTIDAYGVYDPAYTGTEVAGISRASVFVLNKNRKVIWARVESDYKKRSTIEEIRAELSKEK